MTAPSHITTKLWKTWIEANPELALASAERFLDQANANGMFKKMHETDGYVYLVAAVREDELDQYYA
jgi:hypothetical protein